MKSLRLRLTLAFFLASFFSLMLSFTITKDIYEAELYKEVEKAIAETSRFLSEKLSDSSLPTLLQEVEQLTSYQFKLVDEQAAATEFSTDEIKQAMQQSVIHVRKLNSMTALFTISVEGDSYFIQASLNESSISNLTIEALKLITQLNVLIGIVFIMIAASFIVRPIKNLTAITKRVSEGEFSDDFETKRQDEIGQLTNSLKKMVIAIKGMLKVRQDFISNVSHEYQTPITSIKGFAKALREKELSKEQQQQYLQIIENEAERLSKLSQQVLKLSRLQSDDIQPLELRAVRVDESIRETIALLYPQAHQKSIEWAIELNERTIQADAMLLKQLLINVISNAITYAPIASTITVRLLDATNDTLEIQLLDEGPGMSEKQRQFVFEPFYKSAESKGNGLGLAIVAAIVQKHAGTIFINNRQPNGLFVQIILPKQHPRL